MVNIIIDVVFGKHIKYHNNHGNNFSESTLHIDFNVIQKKFCDRLKNNARILDFGCGSGRDAIAFIKAGYRVTAIDGSEKMCRIASKTIGNKFRQMLFYELDDVSVYDGIWACASILHVPRKNLPEILLKMARALVPHGVCYVSVVWVVSIFVLKKI